MNFEQLSTLNIQNIIKDKDYFTFILIISGVILVVYISATSFSGIIIGLSAITVLARNLFLTRKNHRIDTKKRLVSTAYKSICELISDLKKDVHTQQEIRLKDLKNWFPKIENNILEICWKRLQEEKILLEDDDHWIIGNKNLFSFFLVGA